MTLLVLICLGAMIGWVSSILARSEESREIVRQVVLGIAATLIVGLLVNSGTFLGGLTLQALGAALLAGILTMVVYHYVINPRIRI